MEMRVVELVYNERKFLPNFLYDISGRRIYIFLKLNVFLLIEVLLIGQGNF
jgi:hypothetical protein